MKLCCPACNSELRVEVTEADLEIVRVAKPVAPFAQPPGKPQRHPHRQAVEVICRVAKERGFSLSDLRSANRERPLVRARQAAAAAARAETDASLPDIGRILNRDHSTVLHGLRRTQVLGKAGAAS